MQIKVRESGIYTDDPIEHILRLRGIKKEDMAKYLFPDSSLEADYNLLDNIDEGIKLLNHHVTEGSHIRISIDPDADGYTSASYMYQFLTKELGHENVTYYIPDRKLHGINLEDTLEHKPNLLIVPDAGSSNFEEHKILKENGIDCLVIDHHLVEGYKYSEDACVINNQLSHRFENKGLTGVNMVDLFCKAYSGKYLNGLDLSHYGDLVAVGSIADSAPLTDLSVFYYSSEGGKKINNPFIKEILKDNKNLDVSKGLTPRTISWHIAPLINSVTRAGNYDNIKLVVEALFGLDYKVRNNRLKDEFPLAVEALRKAKSTRAAQSTKVKKIVEELVERIEEKGSHENKVLFVNATDSIEEGLSGLVASKIAEKYKRPTLILRYNKDLGELKGSGRNFRNSPLVDFKQALNDTGLFNFALGHASALGISIYPQNAVEAIEALNTALEDIEYNDLLHEVDISYHKTPDATDIMNIATHDWLWGKGLEAPVVHVHDIIIDKKDIRFLGQKGNTLKIDLGSVEGIKFNVTEEEKLALVGFEEDKVKLEIVGECGVNEFKGSKKPQISIVDFKAVPYNPKDENPWEVYDISDDMLPF